MPIRLPPSGLLGRTKPGGVPRGETRIDGKCISAEFILDFDPEYSYNNEGMGAYPRT